MEKKVLGLFFIFISILVISLIASQNPSEIINPDDPLGLGINPDNLPDNPEDLKNISNDYLKQEWTKILQTKQWGIFILGIGSVFEALNPVWKILIGIEYGLSWLFFLTLLFWIAIVRIIYDPLKNILQFEWWSSLGIALIIPAFAARFDIFENFVGFFIPLFTNKWIIIISVIIGGLVVYLYHMFLEKFGAALKEKYKKEKEELREQKAQTVEKLHDIEIKSSG